MIRAATVFGVAVLCSCAPITAERADEICRERASEAAGPSGSIGIGIGSSGISKSASISVSTDALRGKSPDEVYADCMARFETNGRVGATTGVSIGVKAR